MQGGDQDYRLVDKRAKEEFVNNILPKLSLNKEFAKIMNENKVLLMAFDAKILCRSET